MIGTTEDSDRSPGQEVTMDSPEPNYYRGEQPLLKSFVLLGIVFAFPLQLFAFALSKGINNIIGAPWGGIFLFLMVLPYLWFASISIWRSATRFGSLLAATIVKILVGFWVTPWAVAFSYAIWMMLFNTSPKTI